MGGGIACLDGSCPTITNCTLTGNKADLGGGIHCSYSSSPIITNCILWNDKADEGLEIYVDPTSREKSVRVPSEMVNPDRP